MNRSYFSAVLMALALGCAADAKGARDAKPAKDADAAVASAGDLEELMGYDWKVEPGVEAYFCGYKTLDKDLYIDHFAPLMPQGTHHVVLGYQDPAVADGYVPAVEGSSLAPDVCTGVTFGDVFAFAAGVGTEELKMPEGVAVKIPAGKQLVFGLHVLNVTEMPIRGRSGVRVSMVDRSRVVHEAEVIAAQNVSLSVPPGKSTQTATCTMVQDATVFAVMPHMHKTGVRMLVTAGPSGSGMTLLERDYEFMSQGYLALAPAVHLQQGDQIHVECDYENPGPDTLTAGESTDKNEMCIAFAYRYPAVAYKADTDESMGFPQPRAWCTK